MAPGGELFEQIPAGALEMHVPRPAESDALGFEQQLLVGPVRAVRPRAFTTRQAGRS